MQSVSVSLIWYRSYVLLRLDVEYGLEKRTIVRKNLDVTSQTISVTPAVLVHLFIHLTILLTPTCAVPTNPQLFDILAKESNSDVIGWLPHGKAFIIYKKKKFAAEILPKYFKQSKFTSFTRKLNRWGFTRVTRGPETGAYYHKFFQQDNLRLCMQMTCQSMNTKANPPQLSMPPAVSGAISLHTPFGNNNNNNFNSAADAIQLNSLFLGAGSGSGDIVHQNQSLIRRQLQQLQMQQLQLQQLQMQQQQQLQSAELMRQAIAKQSFGGAGGGLHQQQEQSDTTNMDTMAVMQMMMNSFEKNDSNTAFLQSLQRNKESGNAMLLGGVGGPITNLLQPFQGNSNNAVMGEPTRPAAGNGRAWAA